MKTRTQQLVELINDSGLSIREVERELGKSKGYLRMRDEEFSKNAVQLLERYFNRELDPKPSGIEPGDHELIRRWGNKKPTFNDGEYRFRDVYEVKGEDNLQNNGLWKRYDDWAFIGTDKSKIRRIKSGWEGTGELHVDTTGEYTLLENGVKLYRFPKPPKV